MTILNFRINENKKYDFLIIILLYLVCQAPIVLLSNSIFWDDWILYTGSPNLVINIFREQAATLFYLEGPMHIFLLSQFGPWIYKISTLILVGLSGYFLYEIIGKQQTISREVRFFITLFFLILPIYFGRVSLIDFRYTLCCCIFFAGWYFYGKSKILSLACFFVSFNTQSLLVFFAIPVAEIFYRTSSHRSYDDFKNFIFKNLILFFLPFCYFFIKIYFFQPTGSYLGYNQQYSLKNLALSPLYQLLNFFSLNVSSLVLVLVIFVTIVCYGLLAPVAILFARNADKAKARLLIIFGLYAFLFASISYWILGLIPTFNEWSSRHQLLLPLGASFLICGAVASVRKYSIRRQLLALITGSCIVLNISTYFDLLVDWKKQEAMISLISNSKEIRDARVIFFDDRALDLNAIARTYRPYEWSGLMAKAFGNRCRQGYPLSFKSAITNENLTPHLSIDTCPKIDTHTPQIEVLIQKRNQGRIQTLTSLFFNPEGAFMLTFTPP